MKKTLLAISTLGFVVAFTTISAEDQTKVKKTKTPASVGMKIKLELSQDILEGLSTADFAAIEKGGRGMRALNKIEEFARGATPGYKTQLETFRFATNQLVSSARQNNLDGATLAFAQMTISCVNCHKAIRKK